MDTVANEVTIYVNWSASGIVGGHNYTRTILTQELSPKYNAYGTLIATDASFNYAGTGTICVDTDGNLVLTSSFTHSARYTYKGTLTYIVD